MSNIGLSMVPAENRRKSGGSGSSRPAAKRSGGPGRGRGLMRLVVVLVVLGFLVAGAWFAFDRFTGSSAPDYAGEGTGEVVVVIAPGDTVTAIGQELTDKGVTASAQAFVDAAAGDSAASNLQPGSYRLRSQMSGAAAVALITDPAAKLVTDVTIPEGSRLTKVIAIASGVTGIPAEEFQAVLEDPSQLGLPDYAGGNAEGFLYPATYEVQPGATALDVLKPMVAKFNTVAAEIDLEGKAAAAGMKPYDVVITASLLEAEGTPADFGKISRVVANRLADDMRLQFDSTSNYESDTTNIQLTDQQKAANSPYNTYVSYGLPPTPIGQPGEQALLAALNPTPGDWLYFVATDPKNKVTKFTADYQEFLGWVEELNANLAKQQRQQ